MSDNWRSARKMCQAVDGESLSILNRGGRIIVALLLITGIDKSLTEPIRGSNSY